MWCCLQFNAESTDNIASLISYLKYTCHYLECLYDPLSVWRLFLERFVLLFVITGRMLRSSKLSVLNLFTGQKSGFSPHRGDSLHRFTSNLAWPTCTWVRLAVQNFTSIVAGVGMRPKIFLKNHFLPTQCRVASQGRTPWPISKIFMGFYTTNYPTLVFQIWRDMLHRLRSYCWETARRSVRPNFSMHPVGKTVLDRKMIPPFLVVSTSSITMQSLGKMYNTVGSKIWCLSVYFFICHIPRPARCSFKCDILWTGVVSRFMGRFWYSLHVFSALIALSKALGSSIFVARWRHKFREIAVKNF